MALLAGSPCRACGSRAPLKQHRPAFARRAAGGCSAPEHGSPRHRPAVTFGAHRASAPARRPAVACSIGHPRRISATSGRLDGLLGGCGALLRYAIPEGAPLENVPLPARRDTGTFSRTAHPPVREFTCSEEHSILGPRGARERRYRREARLEAHGSGASRFAGCVSIAGMALLLQRRLAPPRAFRRTSFTAPAPDAAAAADQGALARDAPRTRQSPTD
jgi:hypothetical protein